MDVPCLGNQSCADRAGGAGVGCGSGALIEADWDECTPGAAIGVCDDGRLSDAGYLDVPVSPGCHIVASGRCIPVKWW